MEAIPERYTFKNASFLKNVRALPKHDLQPITSALVTKKETPLLTTRNLKKKDNCLSDFLTFSSLHQIQLAKKCKLTIYYKLEVIFTQILQLVFDDGTPSHATVFRRYVDSGH